ncbi:unnamed protein product [Blepharisma stoltei]|uniref:F-box domain-containing protein n=1 Tax=Blepharisma stoltei TaxID=1481888 RepID=A0AAU9ILX5_9CILI|nr:unnamed protein product [Blepharisma stoltei]
MLSLNVFQVICEFLTYKELTKLAQTCKKYKKIADSDKFWKNEAVRLFMSELDLYQIYDEIAIYPKLAKHENELSGSQWKILVKNQFEIKYSWKQLEGENLSKNEIDELYWNISEELKNPTPPIPSLKAEYFPSNYQDLLGNSLFLDPNENSSHQGILQIFNSNFQGFCAEFTSISHISMLISAVYNTWSPDFELKNYPWIMKFYSLLYQMISINCKFSYSKIVCYSGENLLDEYMLRWSAFSAAMQNLSEFLRPFTEMVNYIRNEKIKENLKTKEFKLHILMNKLWKEEVFEKIQAELSENILNLWRKIRSSDSDSGLNLLIKSMDCIIDHSVDEKNLLFKNHTHHFTAKPYKFIHDQAIEKTKKYYESLNFSNENWRTIIDRDIRIVKLAFLPATQKAIEELAYSKIQKIIASQISKEFSRFSIKKIYPYNEQIISEYVYSPIGLLLFHQEKSVSKVRSFISYGLSKESYINLFRIYNDGFRTISTIYDNQDQEIELKAKKCGFSSEGSRCSPTTELENWLLENIVII